jgi:hypothetical protein
MLVALRSLLPAPPPVAQVTRLSLRASRPEPSPLVARYSLLFAVCAMPFAMPFALCFLPGWNYTPSMPTTLPIEQMTWDEKLRAMEALWAELCREEERLESPAWHADVLNERAARVASGEEQFIEWETAKRELRNRLT